MIEEHTKRNFNEFKNGYIVLDDKYALKDYMSMYFSDMREPLDTIVYSLVEIANLKKLPLLEDALDMKPIMLKNAISMLSQEVVEQF